MESLIKCIKSSNSSEFTIIAGKLKTIGIDLNAPVNKGWTCLHYSAYMGCTHIAEELINT